MHFDVLYGGLATRIGSLRSEESHRDCVGGAGPQGLSRWPAQGGEIAQKPPICRFFDRSTPPNFFAEARSGDQNSLDCRGLEGSGDHSLGLNPLARRLAISDLTRHGEVS